MKRSKLDMFEKFNAGLTSEDIDNDTELYHAMLAYEVHGDATRDNNFEELVVIGEKLELTGGAE